MVKNYFFTKKLAFLCIPHLHMTQTWVFTFFQEICFIVPKLQADAFSPELLGGVFKPLLMEGQPLQDPWYVWDLHHCAAIPCLRAHPSFKESAFKLPVLSFSFLFFRKYVERSFLPCYFLKYPLVLFSRKKCSSYEISFSLWCNEDIQILSQNGKQIV